MRWLIRLLRKPAIVLVAITVITGLALSVLVDANGSLDPRLWQPRLEIDPALDRLLPAGDPAQKFHDEAQQLFGDDQTVLIGVRAVGQEGVFDPEAINAIATIAKRLQRLPGIKRSTALSDAVYTFVDGDFIDTGTLQQATGLSADLQAQARQSVLDNPLYAGQLVSSDGQAGLIVLHLDAIEDKAFFAADIPGQIAQAVDEAVANSAILEAAWITGAPIIKAANANALLKLFTFILPVIIAVISALLLLAFRSLRGIVLPVLMIAIAVIWTLGTMAALGLSLNLITILIPPLIITLGLAYAMHVLSEYYAVGGDNSSSERGRVARMLDGISLPMILTGLTTAAGMLALALNPLAAIREFAVFAALGVGYTIFLALTFLPAGLQLIGCKRLSSPPGRRLFRWLAWRLARFDIRYYKVVLVAGAAVLLVSIAGAFQIQVGTDYVTGFPEDSRVRTDYQDISQVLGGANPINIVIDGYVDDTLIRPELLQAVAGLQDWLLKQPEIGSVTSLVDHVRVIHQNFSDGDPSQAIIPSDATKIKQLLIFGGSDDLENYVNNRYNRTRLAVRTTIDETAALKRLKDRIDLRLADLPEPLEGQVTGTSILMTRVVDDMVDGQFLSVGAALFVVYIMLTLLFTSRRVGFLALIPNVLPIAVYFGALGLSGVTLNPTTSLIACIVLGIAVDDTIHYLARFNRDARETTSELRATATALTAVIRPVTFTSLALVLGFLVLTTSELRNQVQFGALAAFTLAVAWLTDVTFTPALASRVKIVTLWDILRLDLGSDPQHSIPLFADLPLRYARIFALLSNVEQVPQGTRVIRKGEDASDIFVVIDGELDVWVDTEGEGRKSLNTLRRGATIGEAGYFGQKRTANCDAVTDCRLLRFNSEDLDRLRRRYPRIAALVFRNLNRIQAERLANTTRMVR